MEMSANVCYLKMKDIANTIRIGHYIPKYADPQKIRVKPQPIVLCLTRLFQKKCHMHEVHVNVVGGISVIGFPL